MEGGKLNGMLITFLVLALNIAAVAMLAILIVQCNGNQSKLTYCRKSNFLLLFVKLGSGKLVFPGPRPSWAYLDHSVPEFAPLHVLQGVLTPRAKRNLQKGVPVLERPHRGSNPGRLLRRLAC